MNDKILTIVFIIIALSFGIWSVIDKNKLPEKNIEQPEALKKYYIEKEMHGKNARQHRYWKYPDTPGIKDIKDVVEFYSIDKGKTELIWTIEDYWILSTSTNTNIAKYGRKYAKEVKDYYKEKWGQ